MAIEKTSIDQRIKLAAAGFVRVDGLRAEGCGSYIIEPKVNELGHYDMNNGMMAIVTMGGEVWLAASVFPPSSIASSAYHSPSNLGELIRELCPRGTGANVPCSNGEALDQREIFYRLARPDWMPGR